MLKVRKFKTDEWVYFCPYPESSYERFRNEKIRSVILEVLPQGDIHDYRIFIDDGTSTIKKVKEKNLSGMT